MSRKVANEATAEELEELERLLVAEPGLHYTLNMVEELTPLPKPGDAATEDELRRKQRGLGMLDELLAPAPAIRRKMIPGRWLAAAGVALLAGAGGILYWMTGASVRESVAETAFGVTKKVVLLPDGSRVVLNAGSKLTYDSAALAKGDRIVTLTGEGFFDVKASAEHPFVIRTGKVDVRVLGTTFNLKAYPKDNRVETFLITGKVEIAYKTKGEEAQVRLRPLEKLVIDLPATGDAPAATLKPLPPVTDVQTMGNMLSVTQTNPEPAWMQGRLEFENVTFEQLTNELERWYNVSITLNNDKLKGEVFSGAFNNKPLPEVLQALQLTMQFQYKSLGDHQIEIW